MSADPILGPGTSSQLQCIPTPISASNYVIIPSVYVFVYVRVLYCTRSMSRYGAAGGDGVMLPDPGATLRPPTFTPHPNTRPLTFIPPPNTPYTFIPPPSTRPPTFIPHPSTPYTFTTHPRTPPTFTPHSSTPSPAPRSDELSSRWLTDRVESWFGSVDQFSAKVVHGTRFIMVDCLLYPCSVFSRQCQVFPYTPSSPSLFAPISSLVVMHSIAHTQGVKAWWRGWYSHLALLVAVPFSNALLEKVQPAPKPGQRHVKALVRYWTLKGLMYAALVPLLSFNFVEMVQSTMHKVYVGGLLEVLGDRPLLLHSSGSHLPFLHLLLPTLLRGVAYECTTHLTRRLVSRCLPRTPGSDALAATSRELLLDFLSLSLAELLLYPLETVTVRLFCQGLPLLVDNVSNGLDVAFISTYYRGLLDCVGGVWDSEGGWGFYKGFSMLLLRHALHGLLLALMWRLLHTLRVRLSRQHGST